MPHTNPLNILLTHDHWATRNILNTCTTLTKDQFHQPFNIGPGAVGGLHDTLTHIISCMRGWTNDLNPPRPPRPNRDPLPSLRNTTHTPQQLITHLDQAAADLASAATTHPLDQTITTTFESGTTVTHTRAVVITHVLTHGTHHRAQCLHMLKQLNISPLPLTALDDWSLQTS